MTNPEYLITHHGADARKLTLLEMKNIYQRTHYENLYKKYDQPRDVHNPYPDIAYHVLVGTDGWELCRDFSIEGYHASNYQVNLNSLAICLTGNYDSDHLTAEMEQYYREAVAWVKKEVPSLKYCNGHRAYANKSCPGGTITDAFIKEVFDEPLPPDNDKIKEYLAESLLHHKKSAEALQKAIKEI